MAKKNPVQQMLETTAEKIEELVHPQKQQPPAVRRSPPVVQREPHAAAAGSETGERCRAENQGYLWTDPMRQVWLIPERCTEADGHAGAHRYAPVRERMQRLRYWSDEKEAWIREEAAP